MDDFWSPKNQTFIIFTESLTTGLAYKNVPKLMQLKGQPI